MSKETTSQNSRRCICDSIRKMDPIQYGSLLCASKNDGGNILSKSHFNEQNYRGGEFGPVEINTELPWFLCEHDGCEAASSGATHIKHEESCDPYRRCLNYLCRKHMPKATSDKIDDVYYCLQLPASQYVTCQADKHQ